MSSSSSLYLVPSYSSNRETWREIGRKLGERQIFDDPTSPVLDTLAVFWPAEIIFVLWSLLPAVLTSRFTLRAAGPAWSSSVDDAYYDNPADRTRRSIGTCAWQKLSSANSKI